MAKTIRVAGHIYFFDVSRVFIVRTTGTDDRVPVAMVGQNPNSADKVYELVRQRNPSNSATHWFGKSRQKGIRNFDIFENWMKRCVGEVKIREKGRFRVDVLNTNCKPSSKISMNDAVRSRDFSNHRSFCLHPQKVQLSRRCEYLQASLSVVPRAKQHIICTLNQKKAHKLVRKLHTTRTSQLICTTQAATRKHNKKRVQI